MPYALCSMPEPVPAGIKFEIRSTKLETNSNVQKNNDPNRLECNLKWLLKFGSFRHSDLFRISDFVLRIFLENLTFQEMNKARLE